MLSLRTRAKIQTSHVATVSHFRRSSLYLQLLGNRIEVIVSVLYNFFMTASVV
jgi:hypothetical protein